MTTRAVKMRATDRQKLKDSISLREIQERYFEIVERNFRTFIPAEVKPLDAGLAAYNDIDLRKQVEKIMPDFLSEIKEFWTRMVKPATIHVQNLKSLKAVYGGGISPSVEGNIVSNCGLYTETIILHEPFSFIAFSKKAVTTVDIARILVENAANILQYKDIALADIRTPILAIVPNQISYDKNESDIIEKISAPYILQHANRLFGVEFTSLNDVDDYAVSLNTVEKVVQSISDQTLIHLVGPSIPSILSLKGKIEHIDRKIVTHERHIGMKFVRLFCAAGMRQTTDINRRCRLLGGSPLTDLTFTWKSFNWRYEYDAKYFSQDNISDLHVNRALQSADSRDGVQWLGNVPPNALVEMRKAGVDAEIRKTLAEGVKEIASADPTDFSSTSNKVFDNVQIQFDKHSKKINELKDKQMDVIKSFAVKGTISLATCFGLGFVEAIANEVTDVPKYKDIYKLHKKAKKEEKDYNQSPMALLFQHKPKE